MTDDPMLALRRDVERLRAYARALEGLAEKLYTFDWRSYEDIAPHLAKLQAEHGVADLMRADDTPQPPGWSGDGD